MPEFKPMLGCAPDPKHPLRWPLMASVKLDGIRCTVINGEAKTRSLKPIPNLHLQKLLSHPSLEGKDMELVVGDPADPLAYNKTFRAVMTIAGEPDVDFHIFDDVSDPTLPFKKRLAKLEQVRDYPENVRVVAQLLIYSQDELDAMYAKVTSMGHEGLILKTPDGTYKFGRSTPKEQLLLKLKPEEDSEFVILGCYEAMENTNEAFVNELGQTDRTTHAEGLVGKSMLGGFHARDIHTGVEFSCAPGKLEHAERVAVWADAAKYINRIGKYRHFPYGTIPDGKPRHPRWIGWRAVEDMSREESNQSG